MEDNIYYSLIDNQLQVCEKSQAEVICLPYDEVNRLYQELGWHSNIVQEVENARNEIKIERYEDHVLFSTVIKDHEDLSREEAVVFLRTQAIGILIYDPKERSIESYIELINKVFIKIGKVDAKSLIPYALTRFDLDTDRAFLSKLEGDIVEIELAMENNLSEIQERILLLRKTLSRFKHYYSRLVDLYEELTEDNYNLYDKAFEKDYQRLLDKSNRLYAYVNMLNEYISQVHDHYRGQVELNLSKTMKIFTIITAVFMPLTLIVGWYGMNFTFMPELESKYGYLYVIILSLTVLACCFYYIKKKGFWD